MKVLIIFETVEGQTRKIVGAIENQVRSAGHDVQLFDTNCSIPDDHIDPRRWALFAARWVLGDSRKEKRHARTTA
jgi:menaquinone-dependent protoporphyrinogen IX oxidase